LGKRPKVEPRTTYLLIRRAEEDGKKNELRRREENIAEQGEKLLGSSTQSARGKNVNERPEGSLRQKKKTEIKNPGKRRQDGGAKHQGEGFMMERR